MLVKFKKLILVAAIQLALIGCAGNGGAPLPVKSSASDSKIVSVLYDQYDDWRGVRHKDGGLSKSGVDCSGFVHLTFKHKLNRSLPRTTELLAKSGTQIEPGLVRPGDLVFFKTGWKKRHVGIYLENGKFMHASSSRGVTISQIQNPYWSEAFWMVRRY